MSNAGNFMCLKADYVNGIKYMILHNLMSHNLTLIFFQQMNMKNNPEIPNNFIGVLVDEFNGLNICMCLSNL